MNQKRFFAELRGRRGAVKGSGISSDRAEYSPKTEVLIAIEAMPDPGSLGIGVRHCLIREKQRCAGRLPGADEEMPDPSILQIGEDQKGSSPNCGEDAARSRGLASPGSRRVLTEDRGADRDSRQCLTPARWGSGSGIASSARSVHALADFLARMRRCQTPPSCRSAKTKKVRRRIAGKTRRGQGVWHLLGSRRVLTEDRGADRDSRQCLTPARWGSGHCLIREKRPCGGRLPGADEEMPDPSILQIGEDQKGSSPNCGEDAARSRGLASPRIAPSTHRRPRC
jgi:hypothetical protein